MSRQIVLKWGDAEFVIPAHKAFQIGEEVEDIATLADIGSWATRPKFFKMARCYGAMLRFAGCKVRDQEVHEAMLNPDGGAVDMAAAIGALVNLLTGADDKKAPTSDGGEMEKTSAS